MKFDDRDGLMFNCNLNIIREIIIIIIVITYNILIYVCGL